MTDHLRRHRGGPPLHRRAVAVTPCIASPSCRAPDRGRRSGSLENLQHTGSFKSRGALVKLAGLTPEQRARGVVAMSAGNHAQGVAYHAQRPGIPATIVMPGFTPLTKVAGTRQYGARVILHGEGFEDATAHARRLEQEEGLTFVHPYDDAAIIAGQGTVGLELLEAVPELDVLVVPIGGGGLIAGCAIAAGHLKPGIEIIGVEAASTPRSIACCTTSARLRRPDGGGGSPSSSRAGSPCR